MIVSVMTVAFAVAVRWLCDIATRGMDADLWRAMVEREREELASAGLSLAVEL